MTVGLEQSSVSARDASGEIEEWRVFGGATSAAVAATLRRSWPAHFTSNYHAATKYYCFGLAILGMAQFWDYACLENGIGTQRDRTNENTCKVFETADSSRSSWAPWELLSRETGGKAENRAPHPQRCVVSTVRTQ